MVLVNLPPYGSQSPYMAPSVLSSLYAGIASSMERGHLPPFSSGLTLMPYLTNREWWGNILKTGHKTALDHLRHLLLRHSFLKRFGYEKPKQLGRSWRLTALAELLAKTRIICHVMSHLGCPIQSTLQMTPPPAAFHLQLLRDPKWETSIWDQSTHGMLRE